jgi:hypothetical protein
MADRRLVGVDLEISSAHTVRVLAGDGSVVCRRKAVPTVASLAEAVLEGTGADPHALLRCGQARRLIRTASHGQQDTASAALPWPAATSAPRS